MPACRRWRNAFSRRTSIKEKEKWSRLRVSAALLLASERKRNDKHDGRDDAESEAGARFTIGDDRTGITQRCQPPGRAAGRPVNALDRSCSGAGLPSACA